MGNYTFESRRDAGRTGSPREPTPTMFGQGSPPRTPPLRCIPQCILWLVLLTAALCGPMGQVALAEVASIRVRFEWAGDEPAIWIGNIKADQVEFSEFAVLGLSADQPGAYVNEGDQIQIWPRYATQAAGLETLITADLDERIRLQLKLDAEQDAEPLDLDFSLRELLQQPIDRKGLAFGYRLAIRRSPGDAIRVRFPRDHLVFNSGERARVDVAPVHTSAKPGSSLRLRLRLREVGLEEESRMDVTDLLHIDDGHWSRTETLKVQDNGKVDPFSGIDLPIPDREGSFELEVELTYRWPLVGTVAQRTIPFVVVDPQRPPLFGNGDPDLVTEFDPADPGWRDYLTQIQNRSNLITGRKRGPWSNQSTETRSLDGREWTNLPKDGWVAYTLTGARPNVPHIVEVEFPSSVPQDVGLSIVEPRADTPLNQLHGEAGISIGDQDLDIPQGDQPPTVQRMLFWPRSNAPALVIANRNATGSATFGKIRLQAYPQGLPVAPAVPGTRQRIAVVRGELLRTLFQTRHIHTQDHSVDSWASFFEAANRLVAYLRFAGYDGATLNVASHGSTLYPSRLLQPTARFDRGIFARLRKDPMRKDVLELLFQLFDREGLTLIPAMEFATPLPELESFLAQNPSRGHGIELVNVGQRRWTEKSSDRDGLSPYYNPLNQHVQAAIDRVVRELTKRYERHESFRGLRINLRAEGFSQLPGAAWGLDRVTLDAFLRDMVQANPKWNDPQAATRLLEQLQDGTSTALVDAWIRWRAYKLTSFYQRIAKTVQSQDRRLFLSLVDLMEAQPWQEQLRPALPRRTSVEEVLMEMGLDLRSLQAMDSLVLLRPNRIASLTHLGAQAINLEANEQDIQQAFSVQRRGGVQYHYESSRRTDDDFDRDGPTRRVRHQFLSTVQPAGLNARRHLASGLATHDDAWIFEGGRMFPFGQEPSVAEFYRIYRSLPQVAFKPVELSQPGPLKAWATVLDGKTIAYFVNTSPWRCQASIQWRAPKDLSAADISALTMGRDGRQVVFQELPDRQNHDVQVPAYGIYSLTFDTDRVELVDCRTTLPDHVAQELRVQLDEIRSREKQIEEQTEERNEYGVLLNPSFDEQVNSSSIKAWQVEVADGGEVQTDTQIKAHGAAAVRLRSANDNSQARIVSSEFPVPETGRLVVFLQLRRQGPDTHPPLVMRLESSDPRYRPFHSFENIGVGEFGKQGLRFVDLPPDPHLRLRLTMELAGPGEVWIDDIRLYDRMIFEEEKKDLKKILHRASTLVGDGDFATCYQTLSGYWPRFLLRHIPPPRVASRTQPEAIPPTKPESESIFDLRRFIRLRK